MPIPIEYETLRVIWWALMGVLLIAFALTDGFDLGVATLLPFVARTDAERRVVINTVGPTWEGNQVWFILGGGAIFAAWPFVYAVAFSGLYLAMFLVLTTLILRPVAFKYRSKRESPSWRAMWDWALFVSGITPALVFGVAVGNVLSGVPFRLDGDLRSAYLGNFLGLFSPFTLVCGLLSVAMLVVHGAAWITAKAEPGPIQARARSLGGVAAIASAALFAIGWAFQLFGGLGYRLVSAAAPQGPSNPTYSQVAPLAGGWLTNFHAHPWMWIAPAAGFVGAGLAFVGLRRAAAAQALAGSALSAFGIVSTVGLAMFPIILPSSVDTRSGLTVWNASSSQTTLFVMLLVTIVVLPVVLAYTAWVYKVLWGRVDADEIARATHDFY